MAERSERSWGIWWCVIFVAVLGAFVLVATLQAGRAAAQQTGSVDLALDERVVKANGENANDLAGASVSGGCDVDGSGGDDAVVGAFSADNNGRSNSGSVYVVFGKRNVEDVDLANLGNRGFRIDGAAAGDSLGFSVACAGDVNGDRTADLIVGAFGADNNGPESGSAYVVFGKESAENVDLANLGNGGFRIDGAAEGDRAGSAVSAAGDTNRDGVDDVIVGANAADNNGDASGSAYVVFGKKNDARNNVNLANLGNRGFRIDGAAAGDRAGFAVGAGRDVNEDGYPDVIVGAYLADNNGRENSGSAYVVFGKESAENVDLTNLGKRGFRIDGAAAGDRTGISVDGTGDVNGGNIGDVVVGADQSINGGPGAAFVVFGKKNVKNNVKDVDLANLRDRGFRINGAAPRDFAGFSVAAAGDINRDRKRDVIVGAYGADPNGKADAGAAYVVYGKANNGTVELATFGVPGTGQEGGLRLDGEAPGDRAGRSVGRAGAFNRDGQDDVLLGADRATNADAERSGAAYVYLPPRRGS
jgi:hypothetical protein